MKSEKNNGGVAEWTIAPVLKTGVPERVPEVRILPPPPPTPYAEGYWGRPRSFSVVWPVKKCFYETIYMESAVVQ